MTETGTESLWRRWLVLWGWGLVAYTLLAVMSTIQLEVNTMRAGQVADWAALLSEHLADNYGYVLFVPPLFLTVRRYPLDRAHWKRSTAVLLAVTFAFVWVKCLVIEPLEALVTPVGMGFESHVLGTMYDMWEIVVVAQAIEFYRRAQERERQAVELREKLTHAQLDALRGQLHPHFLFNTLNGAATLMHTDPAAADRMLTELADLLRATLAYQGTQEIPLGDELGLVERYLAIMRVRFRDRLTVTVDVPAEARAALVPAFLLQPLVENALEHGIGARPGPGRVDIAAAREDGRLLITITDDGPGPGGAGPPGIGIANTRERLAQLYGERQQLTLAPAAGGSGAQVAVTLPWHLAAS